MKLTEKQKNCKYCHGKIGEAKYLEITPNKKYWLGMASNGHVEYQISKGGIIVCSNRIQDPHVRYDRHGNMKQKNNGEPMYDYYDVHKSVNYDIRDTIGW